uniref:centromere-associated protein E isoform X8 n=1 Tax=Doryrhamphus excisus TaxID=161450 RepID=UPI0025AE03C5|nr:centromere-associated protein E isoform X8 [Doryrhamphus excisus]
MAEESAVKVCVRVRPTIEREKNGPSETEAPVQLFWKADKNSIYQIDDGNLTKSFSYDRVFTVEETTNQLYQAIAKPLVVSTVEGYNGTIFAYGQTSSGKTFTMMGSDHAPGVIPLAVEDVFNTIKNCPNKKFLLRVSYMEIYNETVTDLLVDSWKRKPLEVRETINKNIYVADLTEEVVKSPAQALAWIRKGEKNRHYEKTKMNQRSSRSHTIFRMILESEINADGAVIVSHLNLVDLAGSERASQTGAEGTRFKEGCNINRSLFTLGQVIKKLSEESQRGFTNYRDSKLTRILQNSLGGNAKTVIICTITAAALDETLSTLQFASTAKKMKNDPHVTEVSDDGALLKRYRNEIVELKRRLHEVSSVTQTTATEKEVLAQLLQEKDQLQKEQEDRIKNLTKLMVTSTNVAQVQRFPKRRVTWGGKMMRLSAQSACEGSPTNRSFAESATRKRKADRSCLMELVEYDDDFESHWEIPEEPSDDPDSSPSFVTVRGFESRTSCREAELESQLQTASQEKQQALEKAAEVDLQLQSEARQRSEAMAKVETLESSVAELKRQLEEQRHMTQESEKRMQIDFAETVQLCEDLSSEKDALASERNYLKQELGLFMEQTKILEKEVACLSRELEEKRETDEFKSLEEQFRNERENELQNEISSLKMEMESRQLQGLELQKSFETLSEELKQKTKCADDLQNMVAATQGLLLQDELQLQKQNPDLVKEPKDSESSPEEMEKLVSEVAALSAERDSLKMDLQENVDLMIENQGELGTALEKILALKQQIKQLEDSQASNSGQPIDDMTTEVGEIQTQSSPEEMEKLVSEVEALTAERDSLKMDLQENVDLMIENQGELMSALEKISALKQQIKQLEDSQASNSGKPVDDITTEGSPGELEKLISEVEALTAERDSLKMDLQENVDLMIENQGELMSALEKISALKQQIKQLEDSQASNSGKPIDDITTEVGELQTKINNLSQELDHVKAERDSLFLNKEAEHETSTNEIQKLLCKVNLLSEERDQLHETVEGLRQEKSQLRAEMEERMEMLQCEFQLSSAAQSLKEQEDQQNVQIQQLKEQLEKAEEEVTLLKADLQENVQLVQRLTEELEDLRAERDTMQSERSLEAQTNRNEIEKLMDRVTFVTEERYQLQHRLEEMAGTHQNQVQRLTEELEDVRAQRDTVQSERSLDAQTNRDELEKLMERVTFVNEERGQLQDQLEAQKRETSQLRTQLEEMAATHLTEKEQLQDVSEKKNQLETELQQSIDKMKHLSEELGHVKAERDSLCLKKEAANLTSPDKIERLLCQVTSLCEVGDQLHETVEGLRGEKSQLQAEMEERVAMVPNEAKTSNSLLNENQTQTGAKVTVSSCLQDSTLEFQKLFGKLQQFINVCSHMDSTAMKNWDEEYYLTNVYESNLTPPILEAHSTVCRLARETFNCLGDIGDILGEKAKMYKNLFDEFVKKDLSNFEEWNLLLGELQVLPSEDKANFSKQKLAELLVRRQFFLQKMGVIMETLYAGMTACCDDLSADKKGRLNFDEQLEAVLGSQPVALRRLDSILRSEVDRRSTVVESRKIILQGIIHDHNDLCGKVQQLQVQLECHLQKETSRRSSLQQSLGGARSKTKQLEEAHKMNLQQLKAELLDVRSQVEKKENAIQVLKNQLQEKSTSPSAAQLEEVQAKLFKTEMEMSAAFDKHQKEIQRMTVALNDKDRSMWRLKETLRTLQQRGEGSFLQGEELHERLTNPRGLVVTSSVVMEKNKLEEEVKQLQLKIRHLENLVSSQQTEITKWKNRAVKLKVKSKQDSERSPTKCGFPSLASPKRPVLTPQKILDSPKQMLNSPKSTLLDSPKSRFFDGAEKSEILLRTCPKQFFDNSSLGTFSEIPSIPNEADTETDADTKDECSRSPRHEELCKMQ